MTTHWSLSAVVVASRNGSPRFTFGDPAGTHTVAVVSYLRPVTRLDSGSPASSLVGATKWRLGTLGHWTRSDCPWGRTERVVDVTSGKAAAKNSCPLQPVVPSAGEKS